MSGPNGEQTWMDEPWLEDILRCGEAAFGKWQEAHRNEETGAITLHGADGPFYEGIRSALERLRDYHFEKTKPHLPLPCASDESTCFDANCAKHGDDHWTKDHNDHCDPAAHQTAPVKDLLAAWDVRSGTRYERAFGTVGQWWFAEASGDGEIMVEPADVITLLN